MFLSPANELAAAAAAALQRLDAYETTVEEALRQPQDEALYARSVEQFEAIRALTVPLPGLRVRWIEVLISRFELLEGVWQLREGRSGDADLDRLRDSHAAALRSLRRLCERRAR